MECVLSKNHQSPAEWGTGAGQMDQNTVLGYSLKHDRMISVHYQGKPFNIMVIQFCAPTRNAEEAD